jgi:hypothetical protein
MILVAALAAASTFAVAAVTVSGAWSVVWAVFAVLLLGPIVSHLISLRQSRRLSCIRAVSDPRPSTSMPKCTGTTS